MFCCVVSLSIFTSCAVFKMQTTSKNSQRYYTTKRLIRDLLSNAKLSSFADIYLRGMRDRSKRSHGNGIGVGNPAK